MLFFGSRLRRESPTTQYGNHSPSRIRRNPRVRARSIPPRTVQTKTKILTVYGGGRLTSPVTVSPTPSGPFGSISTTHLREQSPSRYHSSPRPSAHGAAVPRRESRTSRPCDSCAIGLCLRASAIEFRPAFFTGIIHVGGGREFLRDTPVKLRRRPMCRRPLSIPWTTDGSTRGNIGAIRTRRQNVRFCNGSSTIEPNRWQIHCILQNVRRPQTSSTNFTFGTTFHTSFQK